MTEPPHNPTGPTDPATPGTALRLARAAIAVGLCAGVLVFGVYAFQQLAQPGQAPAPAHDFGTDAAIQAPATPRGDNAGERARSLGQLDPNKYIPIRRDNPHPGAIEPFLGAASARQPPYRQPNIADEVWELCHYRTADADPEAAFDYYHQQATQRGLTLRSRGKTSPNTPGGIAASWADGSHRLELTAWPTPDTPPAKPPFKPRTPLDWVVKYSYPEGTQPRTPTR